VTHSEKREWFRRIREQTEWRKVAERHGYIEVSDKGGYWRQFCEATPEAIEAKLKRLSREASTMDNREVAGELVKLAKGLLGSGEEYRLYDEGGSEERFTAEDVEEAIDEAKRRLSKWDDYGRIRKTIRRGDFFKGNVKLENRDNRETVAAFVVD